VMASGKQGRVTATMNEFYEGCMKLRAVENTRRRISRFGEFSG